MKRQGNNTHELLERGVDEIIKRDHLEAMLAAKKRLRVKLGIDPTSPDLHLGHSVVLRKLREFQDFGHTVVLIIGDFTARIGDPSGRAEARKPLTEKEITKNEKEYLAQAGKIIDIKKAEVFHNGEWFLKEGVATIFRLASAGSIQQVLHRADFRKRLDADQDIMLLEVLYPLFQGYDSVKVRADVELGGTDQKLNLLMGRRVQRYFDMEEQDILTVPLLEGTDGVRKMSKSVGNYIGLTDVPMAMFGKIMSLPDTLVERYFLLCTNVRTDEVGKFMKAKNPRDSKLALAFEIVKIYHGEKEAEKVREAWVNTFSKKEVSSADIPILKITAKKMAAVDLVLKSGIARSRAQAWRLIEQGGLKIDERAERNPCAALAFKDGTVIKVGKRHFFRVRT